MTNRLAQETSPYLLQHKDNPVDWYAWGEEALSRAKQESKPILVSIGYSACHWCHVMEHESFEDPRVAAVMNERFINIKVDREERPDLDSIYMSAVQALAGQGGWPLNAFLTAEGVPFYGGTYFPPDDRHGMPNWTKVLTAVADAYEHNRAGVEENAAQLLHFLVESSRTAPAAGEVDTAVFDRALIALRRVFDPAHGGFGTAPKFPQPALLEFVLRRWKRSEDETAAGMVRLTLDKMAGGGLYDHIGGGFHRYSVDAVWLVPHFEKMLYDNALLARLYLDAYRAFGDPLYRQVANDTLDYVAREMTDRRGGFYSTQDADTDGEEGKYYVWTEREIVDVLGEENAALFNRYYGVTANGNFEGQSILHVPRPVEWVATNAGIATEHLVATLASGRQMLRTARDQRTKPGRDEKILTSWNGLMLRAFAEGARVLHRPDFQTIAEKNAAFLLDDVRDGQRLLHSYKDGRARLTAYLDDYAFLIDGLLSLAQTTFNHRWLDAALSLSETMIAEFSDHEGVGFFDTGVGHEQLVTRPRDLHDGATPSGNAVAADVLLQLSAITGRQELEDRAVALLATMVRSMGEQPLGFGRYLCGLDRYLATPREVAIAGHPGDPAVQALSDPVFNRYEPDVILGLADPDRPELGDRYPFLAHRPMIDGQTTAYVCEQRACLPPVTSADALAIQLEQGTMVTWREY